MELVWPLFENAEMITIANLQRLPAPTNSKHFKYVHKHNCDDLDIALMHLFRICTRMNRYPYAHARAQTHTQVQSIGIEMVEEICR